MNEFTQIHTLTTEDGMVLLTDQTGFRLGIEVAFEAYRGSMHNRTPDVASGPDRCLVSPLRWHRNLGFRLIREEDT